MNMESIIEFDKQLLLALNGSESLYYDGVMRILTNALTWIPLYLSLFFVILKNNENVQKILIILGCAGLCLLFAGTVDDVIVKPLVARWRPTHDPQIGLMVDIVDGYRGGRYGFFSAHAANTFSIAVFFSLLVRSRLLWVALMAYSLLNCWTRLYLGVHYPIDILVGLTWGAIVGSCVYLVYGRVVKPVSFGMTYTSTHYTSTGYLTDDAVIPVSVFLMTLLYAFIRAAII
jgi:undecaprenyl-diphosphatase